MKLTRRMLLQSLAVLPAIGKLAAAKGQATIVNQYVGSSVASATTSVQLRKPTFGNKLVVCVHNYTHPGPANTVTDLSCRGVGLWRKLASGSNTDPNAYGIEIWVGTVGLFPGTTLEVTVGGSGLPLGTEVAVIECSGLGQPDVAGVAATGISAIPVTSPYSTTHGKDLVIACVGGSYAMPPVNPPAPWISMPFVNPGLGRGVLQVCLLPQAAPGAQAAQWQLVGSATWVTAIAALASN